MEFWLQKDNDSKFQLPVKPSEYNVTVSHKNTVVNVLQLGDINLMGKTGLREISLSSFFPAKDYNFSNNSGRKTPLAYVEKIEAWRNSGEPIRVIITGILNMECTIESFSYGEQDATGDIYYTASLKEYKKIKTKTVTSSSSTAKASSKRSAKTSISGGTYTVKKGDSLWKIAKQFYGNGALYMKIYEANKNIISDPNKIYVGQVLTIPEYSGSKASTVSTTTQSKSSTSGSKTNPPFTILTSSYGVVKSNITTWNEAYGYYTANGGSSKGWKIVDANKNVVTM